jgi:hypothetical protein
MRGESSGPGKGSRGDGDSRQVNVKGSKQDKSNGSRQVEARVRREARRGEARSRAERPALGEARAGGEARARGVARRHEARARDEAIREFETRRGLQARQVDARVLDEARGGFEARRGLETKRGLEARA